VRSVLVVDDQPEIVRILRDYLERAGFSVLTAADGAAAVVVARRDKPDLIVLDLTLPTMDGLDVARALRREGEVPIIMLTARTEEADRVSGLELGADDYVTKPFSPRELMARVKAHLRRGEQDETEDPAVELLKLGPFTLDRAAHRLCLREQELTLTSTEFRLLEFFLMHPGRAYNREQLLEEVWGQQHYVSPRTVDVHVRRLRERIETQPDDPQYLTTVRGFGYRFELPASEAELQPALNLPAGQ
jgi:two-component system, OmpR family, response regulator ResD